MSRSRRRSGGNAGRTLVNTPEAKAPENEPVDIVFEPIEEEPQYFNEDEPVPSSYDPEIAEVLDAPPAPVCPDAEHGDARADDPDADADIEDEEDVPDDGEDAEEAEAVEDGPAEEDDDGNTEVPLEDVPPADLAPPVQDSGAQYNKGDVLNDQTALLQADDDAVREQREEEDVGDRMPVDPDPADEEEDDEEDGDGNPGVESDEGAEEKDSVLFKIPLVGPLFKKGFDLINKIGEFKRTFYDRKYWIANENKWHNNMVRSRMMREGWTFLHRVWWDLKLGCYRDDIMFVKEKDLTKQHPRHLNRYGERAIPDQSTGEWVIFNSKIAPPEYEGENGFTASSAYLFMMDTSGEKAIRESTVDLKSKEGPDRFFIILIGGAFIIIFGYFLLGGFGHRSR